MSLRDSPYFSEHTHSIFKVKSNPNKKLAGASGKSASALEHPTVSKSHGVTTPEDGIPPRYCCESTNSNKHMVQF
jgi:hypothetical protein